MVICGIDTDARAHRACRVLLEGAQARKVPGVLVPQVLLEAFAVITDPRRVRRPMPPAQAWSGMEALARALTVVYPQSATLVEFAGIVQMRAPVAQSAFDAFLVAQMRSAGIATICTFDARGFAGYQEINVETPDTVLSRFGLAP